MKRVHIAKGCYLLMSVAVFLLGCVLLFRPGASLTVLVRIVGGLLLLSGVTKLFGYFANDLYRIAFQFDLALGLLISAAGVLILIFPQGAAARLTELLAVFVLVDALITVQNAIDAKRFGIRCWWLLLCCAVAAGAFAIAVLASPHTAGLLLMRITGAALILNGIQNMAVALLTVFQR